MRVLSLFSGGGLGDYGLTLAGMEIVGQVEIDNYCQKILALRWPDVPKWRDIREVKGSDVLERCGAVELVSGGFPCQPFSVAGKKLGEKDKRNMWPEMHRVISEIKPAWVLAENVRGIVKPYLDTVLSDLESLGYSCLTLLIPASAIGAPHRRERLWIIAYAESIGTQRRIQQQGELSVARKNGKNGGDTNVADAKQVQESQRPNWWAVEPNLGRVAHGAPNRVDRLKLLGNGQVVQVVEWIGKQIMEFDKQLGDKK